MNEIRALDPLPDLGPQCLIRIQEQECEGKEKQNRKGTKPNFSCEDVFMLPVLDEYPFSKSSFTVK